MFIFGLGINVAYSEVISRFVVPSAFHMISRVCV